MTEKLYRMYFWVRKDLKMGAGKIATQVAHATSRITFLTAKNRILQYFEDLEYKYVYGVESLEELLEIRSKIQNSEFFPITYLVQDAGITQVQPQTITCFGALTQADYRGQYKLLK